MKKNILIAIGVLVLITIVFGGFLIFKKRNLPTSKNQPSQAEKQSDSPAPSASSNLNPSNDNQAADDAKASAVNSSDADGTSNETKNDSTSEQPASNESFLDVTTKDCDNQCKDYTDSEDLKYCQNICGLAIPSKDSVSKTTKCETIEDGLEADYCFKNQAISKKDPKLCSSILDGNIKKSCINRFLEDVLEESQLE